ncbi:MAG TPA: S4 domain-containing protein, partial [Candidatus Angelobacter sp.]|nr:S4 domain-containing protein [Candidatus Angelobacter sp.]
AEKVISEGSEVHNAQALTGGKNLADIVEGPVYMRVDKLLRESGLADSASDGVRKVKQNAVRINGQPITSIIVGTLIPVEHVIRVGKRIKNVRLTK